MTAPPEAVELVGRAAELGRLGALVDGARAGRGGALLVEGPPGVGKSALLQAVAASPGVRVLAVTGVETEIDLPFAGLAELLHPVLDHVERLPDPQRGALRAALALDAPRGDDRAVVLHAVAASLAAVAADGPLLLAVDDLQWLDPSSRSVVEFVARRAERLGLAVVAVRSLRGDPAEPWPACRSWRWQSSAAPTRCASPRARASRRGWRGRSSTRSAGTPSRSSRRPPS